MERNEIIEKIRILLVENLEIKHLNSLNEKDRLYEDLNVDSIMVLQLMVYIEEAFTIVIPEEDVDPLAFQTVGSLVSFIQRMQGLTQE
ncbi:phosphopantetheine-binding protein [Paenibacillus oryzisoli]|uniref:phosphopantetheine-binding protein n=1 Tax=Paenibacillus oryzisoli TaxID=1850517 RepID=UPI003D271DD0